MNGVCNIGRRKVISWMAHCLVLATLLSACGRAPSAQEWLASVVEANRTADDALLRGDLEVASRVLVEVLNSPEPVGLSPGDQRVILQDVAFRLAEIDLQRARPRDALQWAEAGLEQGRNRDLFTANLLVVRGHALENLGRDREAASDYYAALLINDILLRQSLGQQEDE